MKWSEVVQKEFCQIWHMILWNSLRLKVLGEFISLTSLQSQSACLKSLPLQQASLVNHPQTFFSKSNISEFQLRKLKLHIHNHYKHIKKTPEINKFIIPKIHIVLACHNHKLVNVLIIITRVIKTRR